jgi:hypothetical protein
MNGSHVFQNYIGVYETLHIHMCVQAHIKRGELLIASMWTYFLSMLTDAPVVSLQPPRIRFKQLHESLRQQSPPLLTPLLWWNPSFQAVHPPHLQGDEVHFPITGHHESRPLGAI